MVSAYEISLEKVILFLIGPKNTFNNIGHLQNRKIRKETVS